MEPRIEITKDHPRPGFSLCEVKVGAGKWEHTFVARGNEDVLAWLADRGIALVGESQPGDNPTTTGDVTGVGV